MTEEKNELQTVLDTIIFNNDEFNNIRGVSIDGKPWFVGKDICGQFGDTNHKRSLSRIDSSDKMMIKIQTAGGKQTMTVINESGLYALLFMMQPAKAKGVSQNDPLIEERIEKLHRFKRWVTSEVLPQIRKTGGYIPIEKDDDDLAIMAKALNIMQNTLEQKDELLVQKEEVISQQKPLVDFANTVSATETMVDMKTMAKLLEKENQDIHMGRNKLFAWLRKEGYLMSDNTPYERYVKQGIFKLTESEVETKNGSKLITKTYVTGKGQLYLAKKLAEYFASQSASA